MTMKKIIIYSIIAFVLSFLLGPSDIISQFMLGLLSVFFCVITLLILARFSFVKVSSPSMKTLVCILICIISILLIHQPLSMIIKIIEN
jgi:hypothetical protein